MLDADIIIAAGCNRVQEWIAQRYHEISIVSRNRMYRIKKINTGFSAATERKRDACKTKVSCGCSNCLSSKIFFSWIKAS